jgi:DNA polymerase I-like protein with 3'-5' exonuclease and polymerase domains
MIILTPHATATDRDIGATHTDTRKPQHIKKVGQNLKYDKHVLANHGIALNGIAHDTLLQSYVLESHRTHGMDDLAMRHLGCKRSI